jgi:MFS family permease
MENKKLNPRVYFVTMFTFIYTFSRQIFLPCAKNIDLPGINDPSNFFSIANLTSITGLIYACLQIPYGIVIDIIGINRMVTILSGTMSLGLGICALSTTNVMFGIGRIITFLGCGGAFISAVKTLSNDIGSEKTGNVIGFVVAGSLCVSIGFIKYIAPTIIEFNDSWRYLYGILTLLVGSIFLFFFNTKKKTNITDQQMVKEKVSFKECILSIKESPKMLTIILYTFFFFMIFYSINETPFMANFLNKTLGLATESSYSLLLLGFLLGFFTTPMVAKKVGKIKYCFLFQGVLIALAAFMIMNPSAMLAYCFLTLVGYSNGLQMVIVMMASNEIPKKYMGMLSGIMNCLFLGGAIVPQQLFRYLIPKVAMGEVLIFYFVIFIALLSTGLMTVLLKLNNGKEYI